MPSLSSVCSVLLAACLIQNTIAESKCYALNGTQLGSDYGPCDPNANHSGCCAIHRSVGSVELCLSNDLCMATKNEYMMGIIWQSACTDPTGMDPSCPKRCPDARDNFCNNTTAQKIKTKLLGAFQFEISTAGITSTATSTSMTSSSTAAASSSFTSMHSQALAATAPSNTASTEPALCAAEKRQIAVVEGTLAGISSVAILSLLAAVFYLYQKEKKQRKLKEHYEEQFATTSWGAYGSRLGSKTTFFETSADGDPIGTDPEVRYIGRKDT
ncbi:hypothetical protein BU23DRAFT_53645 [Bimuria novae-zelandiae CBS 107.79]|uniref:Mid2 domain-containing protein n=1 Tax=Bimuria novae-zelandiae CBS 107.79 TaxID=1447943 RepID=A0A6A5UI82_9PLEO|nr:hypothetical protein BU23DRAFT_53645 [Bimuria novae-zelandiae CBS 107.79]